MTCPVGKLCTGEKCPGARRVGAEVVCVSASAVLEGKKVVHLPRVQEIWVLVGGKGLEPLTFCV
jgi:hypothetical protein